MGPVAIPALLGAAAGGNLAFAAPARELLPLFGESGVDALIEAGSDAFQRDNAKCEEATTVVARIGVPALERVVTLFTSSNPYGSRFYFSVGVLARMDGLAVEPLIPLLKHPTKEVRLEAATLLADFGDPRSFDALLEGLRGRDEVIRMQCARGLGKIGDHRAGDVLLSALRAHDWGTRAAASGALATMFEPRFLRPIARVARSDSEIMTRNTAASVLIEDVRDPIAVRLGRRYKPVAMSPALQGAIVARNLSALGATGLCLLGVGAWGTYAAGRKKSWRRWLVVGTAALAAGALGFVWGRVVESISGAVENGLLLFVIPAVGLFGYAVVVLESRCSPVRVVRRLTWLVAIAGFYLGYGVGWAALWGHLGR
jgi:hypothetical protein